MFHPNRGELKMGCCSNCSREFAAGDFVHRYTGLKCTEGGVVSRFVEIPFAAEEFCSIPCLFNKFWYGDLSKKKGEDE